MNKRSYFNSIRGKITNRVLFIGIAPMLVIGVLAWLSLSQLTNNVRDELKGGERVLLDKVVGSNLISISSQLAAQIDAFMLERISDAISWSVAPVVLDAARAAAVLHKQNGLNDLLIRDVEAKFSNEKSYNVSPKANAYLKTQISRSKHFGEAFFTDNNGFNVALTNPTSDFVQRDENWWKTAWENGISVGEVEFDDSAGIWSVDISVRIDDPASGRSLGVLKSVLGVSLIQELADVALRGIESGAVTVVNSDGLLLAETSSQHVRERIMNSSVNFRKSKDGSIKSALSSGSSGYVIGDHTVLGYAPSAGAELYGETVDRFGGFKWVVIVQQPTNVALAPIQGLTAVQDRLSESQGKILLLLAIVTIVIFILAIVVAGVLAKGITEPLLELSEHADAISKGDMSRTIDINSDDEIGDVADSLKRLMTSLSIILNRYKALKAKSA